MIVIKEAVDNDINSYVKELENIFYTWDITRFYYKTPGMLYFEAGYYVGDDVGSITIRYDNDNVVCEFSDKIFDITEKSYNKMLTALNNIHKYSIDYIRECLEAVLDICRDMGEAEINFLA